MESLVSFIIPMYNAEQYIKRCIDSIICQGLPNEDYEIIVIDDGSTDNGKMIVHRYPQVRYFHKENGGQSSARNLGIEKAISKYICFVDADDYFIKHTLGKVVEMAETNSLDLACYQIRLSKDGTDSIIERTYIESKTMTGFDYIANFEYNNGPWWYLIRREFINENKLRFMEGRFAEDGMFTTQALLYANKVKLCNQFCYMYFQQPNSTTQKRKGEKHLLKIMDDYLFASIHIKGLAEEYKLALPEKAYKRLSYRSESYIFFLLARLLKFPYKRKGIINDTIKKLRRLGVYPIRRPNQEYYPGTKVTLVTYIVNRPLLLKICNKLIILKQSFIH